MKTTKGMRNLLAGASALWLGCGSTPAAPAAAADDPAATQGTAQAAVAVPAPAAAPQPAAPTPAAAAPTAAPAPAAPPPAAAPAAPTAAAPAAKLAANSPCAALCTHSAELKCKEAASCEALCKQSLVGETCNAEQAAATKCMLGEPTAHWECSETGVAALKDGFCNHEQEAFVECVMKEQGG